MLPVAVIIVSMVPRGIVLKVPQQGADVDEDAAGPKAVPDDLEIAYQIWRRVQKEDAGYDVVLVLVVLIAVEAKEVGRAHGHLPAVRRLSEGRGRVDVRDLVAAQMVRTGAVVGEGVYPGVDGVLARGLALVEDI